ILDFSVDRRGFSLAYTKSEWASGKLLNRVAKDFVTASRQVQVVAYLPVDLAMRLLSGCDQQHLRYANQSSATDIRDAAEYLSIAMRELQWDRVFANAQVKACSTAVMVKHSRQHRKHEWKADLKARIYAAWHRARANSFEKRH